MYIYPDNLKSKATLWLWQLKDIGIIGACAVVSILFLTQAGFFPPIVLTAAPTFLTIRRAEDTQYSGFICVCVLLNASSSKEWMIYRMKKKKISEKKEAKQRASTRQLIGAKAVTDYSLVTYGQGELVYFIVKPSNISVLSEASIGARIYALMTVLKGVAEIEMLCLNSRESFENNKQFLKMRMEQEDNPVIRKLLEKDQNHLDRIQVQMATAREFLILIRLKDEKESEVFPYLSRIEKSLKEQGFSVKRADKEDIKRLLAVYYEQNVTTEKFEDFDGERWIIPED